MYLKLAYNSKVPPRGEVQRTDDERIVREWLHGGFNVGLCLRESHRVVVDFDGVNHVNGKEIAREFYERYRKLFGEPPQNIVETPSGGIHCHFEGETKTRGLFNDDGEHIGDLKNSGHVVLPPSTVGKPYRWLRQGPLQEFPESMFPVMEKTRAGIQTVIDENDPIRRLIRAREWMKHREGKEDGNGRGLQTIKTCRALFGMFGLTEDQVWPLILEYNERCQLGYTVEDLRHKICDSQKGD